MIAKKKTVKKSSPKKVSKLKKGDTKTSKGTKKPSSKKATTLVKPKTKAAPKKSSSKREVILNALKARIESRTLPIDNRNPSEVIDSYWVVAYRQVGEYKNPTINSGKWLIFAHVNDIDEVWKKIKLATEHGLLGSSSKVSTAKKNPNSTDEKKKVICVYTYDYTDKEDVLKIREELRKLGITGKIPYKSDRATRQGEYQVKGNTKISVYFE